MVVDCSVWAAIMPCLDARVSFLSLKYFNWLYCLDSYHGAMPGCNSCNWNISMDTINITYCIGLYTTIIIIHEVSVVHQHLSSGLSLPSVQATIHPGIPSIQFFIWLLWSSVIWLSVHSYDRLSVRPTDYLSVHLTIHPTVCPSKGSSDHLTVSPSIWPSIWSSHLQSVHLHSPISPFWVFVFVQIESEFVLPGVLSQRTGPGFQVSQQGEPHHQHNLDRWTTLTHYVLLVVSASSLLPLPYP